MRNDSMAVQWEKRVPGFVARVLERAAADPNPLVFHAILDFLRWVPTEEEQRLLDELRRQRGIRLCDEYGVRDEVTP